MKYTVLCFYLNSLLSFFDIGTNFPQNYNMWELCRQSFITGNKLVNIGMQGMQELFFCELKVSEIGAFMELFKVIIWLIWQVFLVATYSKKETGNLWSISMLHR